MFLALCAALLFANNTSVYNQIVHQPVHFQIMNATFDSSLKEFVTETLMVAFFAYIGMELKIEFHSGVFANKRQALLPFLAAFGGVITPAIIYLCVNKDSLYQKGFAIPCATDIAFAVCLFNVVAKSLPHSTRSFLLAIAVFDDLIAMLIIGVFYMQSFDFGGILMSLLVLGMLVSLYISKTTRVSLYVLCLVLLYIAFTKSHINTTLSGFIVGFALPISSRNNKAFLKPIMNRLQPFVQLIVLPLFAFVAGGVIFGDFKFGDFSHPIVLGIVAGLVLGKQFGITLFSYIAIKLGMGRYPANSTLKDIFVISTLAGVGFTMSLFIATLAFTDQSLLNLSVIGILTASILSAILSFILVRVFKHDA